ncbi:hypothetical protein [Reyranella sp.]|uniref:hypothetical protein n=1 Tax=Reyranella sp. TaxID=1929291 RepID=UPI003D115611
MRIEQTHPAALGRQLAEWRQPLDADPDLDAAVMRLLSAIERQLQRPQYARERKD